jgi:LacI family transcriptional regulator
MRHRLDRKAVTILEIAREAGVSAATVSRFFNHPVKVKKETRDSVMAAIDRNHYVADGLAGSLSSRRSRLLGLIIPTITNSIYASSTQAVQQAAQNSGYTILVGISEFSEELEAKLIHQLLARRVEGLILTGQHRSAAVYEKIKRNHCPFVITWKLSNQADLPSVSFNNFKAATTAVEHLLLLGHRRIGLVCGKTELNDRALDRRRAFEKTLRRFGIEPDANLIFERDFEFIEGRAAMQQMLTSADPPTAVFCANDIQAIGAMSGCRDAGVSVPNDISIIGFDDLPIAKYVTPQLTTIRVPAQEMGLSATRRITAAIEGGAPLSSLELQTELIVRESTAPPRSAAVLSARSRRPRKRRTIRSSQQK